MVAVVIVNHRRRKYCIDATWEGVALGFPPRLGETETYVVELTGDPGDVYLVHPLTMHASLPNCLATPRMVLSTTVYRRGIDCNVLYGPEREALLNQ
jgi:hypothetical protein